MGFIQQKKPMKVFLVQALIVTLVIVVVGGYLKERYRIGFGGQKRACLPWDVYLTDTYSKKIKVGDLVAFIADERMEPKFKAGSTVIKQVAGVAGDQVVVDSSAHYIVAGKNYGTIVKEGAEAAQKDLESLLVSSSIPEGQIAVIGTLPRSFDSRYWGYVDQNQIVGRAYGIY